MTPQEEIDLRQENLQLRKIVELANVLNGDNGLFEQYSSAESERAASLFMQIERTGVALRQMLYEEHARQQQGTSQ